MLRTFDDCFFVIDFWMETLRDGIFLVDNRVIFLPIENRTVHLSLSVGKTRDILFSDCEFNRKIYRNTRDGVKYKSKCAQRLSVNSND